MASMQYIVLVAQSLKAKLFVEFVCICVGWLTPIASPDDSNL